MIYELVSVCLEDKIWCIEELSRFELGCSVHRSVHSTAYKGLHGVRRTECWVLYETSALHDSRHSTSESDLSHAFRVHSLVRYKYSRFPRQQ